MDRKSLLALSVAALLVLVIAVAVVLAGGSTPGPVASAQNFFAAVASGGPQAAYEKASPAFRSATSTDAWASTTARHDLSQYARSTWTQTSDVGNLVTLNGLVTLKSGVVQPATLKMVKDDKGWSVYSIDLPNGGVTGGAAPVVVAAAPAAPSGAPGGDNYATAAPAPAAAAPPVQPQPYPVGPYAAQSAGAAQGPMLTPGRLAHDCGPKILRIPGIEAVDVHCPDGVQAAAGVAGRCQAMINGRPATVRFVVQSYDPARDDAELTCRPY